MSTLTLRKIKNTNFPQFYRDFITNNNFSYTDYGKMLSLAIIFINSDNIYVQRLGYRIIVMYSNKTNDYAPLYEIAINKGLYPVAKFIDAQHFNNAKKTFFTELNASFFELYKSGNVYFSEEQYQLNSFYSTKQDDSVSIVAPTSYGKTELILKTIQKCRNKNICIITPTKSLLAQTRKRILSANIDWVGKVIIHPEMYNQEDTNYVAVLTQERLLRLLKNNDALCFDYVIIDEAHDLLEQDQRDEMLASAIVILNKRNPQTAFKFLTPFIKNTSNLKVRYTTYDLSTYIINEYIKTEKIFVYDIRSNTGLMLYDQYINEWHAINGEPKDYTSIQFIVNHASDKNIIYFNKPSDIEAFAREMIVNLPDIEMSTDLEQAVSHISEYISSEYTLVKGLKKGIIYHHGSVPDSIRLYIEHLYSVFPEIKYIITSSTLLEGVNIPASRMFLMDNRKGRGNLSPAAFKNLIGRVCRFSEVFNSDIGSMKKLEPEVYLVFDKYYRQGANIKNFVTSVMKVDKEIDDEVNNVLLENTQITETNANELSKAREFLENYENGTISNYTERYAETEFGKTCVLNSITEIDVFSYEHQMQQILNNHIANATLVADSSVLIDLICNIFLPFVNRNDENNNLLRFSNEAARNYYKMFLSWKLDSMAYNQMITYTIRYWRSLISQQKDTIVYVGKWGDLVRGEGHSKLWTDIRLKDQSQLINLAIVRIKEEQDFIDNTIMKFVEVLNDLNVVDQSLYRKLKYGTDGTLEIVLIKNGISLSLAKLFLKKYRDYVVVNVGRDTISISEDVINAMNENDENQILIYEAKTNIF